MFVLNKKEAKLVDGCLDERPKMRPMRLLKEDIVLIAKEERVYL